MRLKTKTLINIILGISTEILYALCIIAAAFLISLIIALKK